jgi:hypothetical protein
MIAVGDYVEVIDPASIAIRQQDGAPVRGNVTRVEDVGGATVVTFRGCNAYGVANVNILRKIERRDFRWRA